MIRKIKFSNFYSFNGEQEIDFTATKKKNDYSYYNSPVGDQITKVAGFIGDNASGKTNILRVFSFLGYFICSPSRPTLVDLPFIAYKAFFGNSEPSSFYIEFEIDQDIYKYSLTLKNNIVESESLNVKKIGSLGASVKVFSRTPDGVKLNDELFRGFDEMEGMKNIRSDVSLISYVRANYQIDVIGKIFSYFSNFGFNINERGDKFGIGYSAIKYLEDEQVKTKTDNYFIGSNTGLKGFKVERDNIKNERGEDIVRISVWGIHNTEKGDTLLYSDYESTGTKSLFCMIDKLTLAIKNNGVAIIDEIETGLHPEALYKLIGYFIDENEESRAQLIFSSHSLEFMGKLDMQQIYLVEKNEDGESRAYRLDSVEGVRSDDNFMAKYMSGAYGAFPDIRV
ncbi:ATP-binding protein [Candidatus Uhrbacteria bacterium]|nr:ATP-binding protein [Candidatus Uhrbacteria bacterium]